MYGKNEVKKGVFFSLDALIALIIILITMIIVYPNIENFKSENRVHSDITNVLSNLKIGETNNTFVKNLIYENKISDLNKSVLEQIGEFYVENITLAKDLASSVLSDIESKENFGLWYGNTPIFLKNLSSFENAKNVRVDKQIISGIKEGSSVKGYSGRAFLSSDFQTKYFYFGGYSGDGNISIKIDYFGDLEDVKMEIAVNKDFDIYINDLFSGHYTNSSSQFIPAKYDLNAYRTNFHSGENILKISEKDLFIAGGYIKISYSNVSAFNDVKRYYFPGVEGIINIYDGFYIPGNLNEMNILLHYNSNYSVFLNIGNVTVFNESSAGIGETSRYLNNTELSSKLNYSSMTKKTIPLRIGLNELKSVGEKGNADVIIITDISGSMEYRLNSDSIGIARNCSDPQLYDSSTKRISIAKCLDKMVVDIILNVSGNRVGLSAFYGDNSYPYKGRVYEEGLTNNSQYLKSKIDQYVPQDGTPICAAINDAYKILSEQSNPNRTKFVIVMSDGIPTHTCASSGCEGTRTGLQSDEALWLGYGAGCYGGSDDCNVNDCNCASQNANWSSCRLHNGLNATVYSVGFGPVSSCNMANKTLKNIANCGNGKYYSSDNATLLEDFYRLISYEILELSYSEQISKASSGLFTKIYPDSYIEFNYTSEQRPYGLLVSLEKKFSDKYSGTFDVPSDSRIANAKVVSYSGPRWTKEIKINNVTFYNLSLYGRNYKELGDPYNIAIPESLIQNLNNITLITGISPENSSEGSENNKIIYTLVKNFSSYSSIQAHASGCSWEIEFEDNTNYTLKIPKNYSGQSLCYYKEGKQEIGDENDAINIAVLNLFRSLDSDSNGKIDIKINEQNLGVNSYEIVGVPYSWSTKVEIRTWD